MNGIKFSENDCSISDYLKRQEEKFMMLWRLLSREVNLCAET
jgi:hypothetical protein